MTKGRRQLLNVILSVSQAMAPHLPDGIYIEVQLVQILLRP